jgi:hypothetical protein
MQIEQNPAYLFDSFEIFFDAKNSVSKVRRIAKSGKMAAGLDTLQA